MEGEDIKSEDESSIEIVTSNKKSKANAKQSDDKATNKRPKREANNSKE